MGDVSEDGDAMTDPLKRIETERDEARAALARVLPYLETMSEHDLAIGPGFDEDIAVVRQLVLNDGRPSTSVEMEALLNPEEQENLGNWLWQKEHHGIADSSVVIGPGSALLVGALHKLAERERGEHSVGPADSEVRRLLRFVLDECDWEGDPRIRDACRKALPILEAGGARHRVVHRVLEELVAGVAEFCACEVDPYELLCDPNDRAIAVLAGRAPGPPALQMPQLPEGWEWDDYVACDGNNTSVWVDADGELTVSQRIVKPIPTSIFFAVLAARARDVLTVSQK